MIDFKITKKQNLWLTQKGGRNSGDVRTEKDGRMFVLMGDGHGGSMRIYVPVDEQLQLKTINEFYEFVEEIK